MSLPLRITFENRDHTYTLKAKNITPNVASIQIDLNGETYTLVRTPEKNWHIAEEITTHPPGLLQAIAKNIILRYRL